MGSVSPRRTGLMEQIVVKTQRFVNDGERTVRTASESVLVETAEPVQFPALLLRRPAGPPITAWEGCEDLLRRRRRAVIDVRGGRERSADALVHQLHDL